MIKTKEQLKEYNRKAQQRHRLKKKLLGEGAVRPATGIENENQIDSVIREMAESQVNIDREKSFCQYRISLIQKYTSEIIEPDIRHQAFLRSIILNFLKKQKVKRFFRKYRFGSVSFSCGKLEIKLNIEMAKQRIEMP